MAGVKGRPEEYGQHAREQAYGVTELDGEAATIERIVSALKEEPGFVILFDARQQRRDAPDRRPGVSSRDEGQPNIRRAYRKFKAELTAKAGLTASYRLPDKNSGLLPRCTRRRIQMLVQDPSVGRHL